MEKVCIPNCLMSVLKGHFCFFFFLIFHSQLFFFLTSGTLSVLYIVIFVIVHAVRWGPHLHFNVPKEKGPTKCKQNYNYISTVVFQLNLVFCIISEEDLLTQNKSKYNNKKMYCINDHETFFNSSYIFYIFQFFSSTFF